MMFDRFELSRFQCIQLISTILPITIELTNLTCTLRNNRLAVKLL